MKTTAILVGLALLTMIGIPAGVRGEVRTVTDQELAQATGMEPCPGQWECEILNCFEFDHPYHEEKWVTVQGCGELDETGGYPADCGGRSYETCGYRLFDRQDGWECVEVVSYGTAYCDNGTTSPCSMRNRLICIPMSEEEAHWCECNDPISLGAPPENPYVWAPWEDGQRSTCNLYE